MKQLLIDTNAYSAFKNEDERIVKKVQTAERLLLSTIVLGELYCGFKCGNKENINMDELASFVDSKRVFLIENDETTAQFYAEIYRDLRNNGTPIPTNDIWIAASTKQHGATLLSLDSHFKKVPGLSIVELKL